MTEHKEETGWVFDIFELLYHCGNYLDSEIVF
jgi:hypothetical protein